MKSFLRRYLYNSINWKTILLCIVIFSVGLVGCEGLNEDERVEQNIIINLETMEEPLRIFYDGTGEYLIKSFMSTHPEVNIELVECLHIGDDEINLQGIISKNGVPDLIIGGEELSGYLPEWYREGCITDVGEFCASDVSIDTDDYFSETFEVFRDEECLYALPLGISVDFMLISESKYYGSAFSRLEEGYTGRELLSILLEEVQKEKQPGEFFSEINRTPLKWMYCLDGLTQTENGIQMDEELFRQVYELAYQNKRLQAEARSFWSEQGKEFEGSTGYAFPCALDPRRYEGNFTVDIGSLDDAAALVLSYSETIYQYYTEEGIKAIYLPTLDDGSKYQAKVKVWGAVAEESERKELAYELLRALMDEEINYFGRVRGANPGDVNVYSVNKANAMSLLERFENQVQTIMVGNEGTEYLMTVDRIDVNKEEKEKHEKMLSNISGLYCWTNGLSKVDGIFNDYFDANISDYETCYLDMLNTLNSDDMVEYIPNLSDVESGEAEITAELKEERDETAEAKELKEKIKGIEVGNTFFLGETEQDNNLENGAEPIEWVVLEKVNGKVFVISKKVIEWLTFSKYDAADADWFTWNIDRNQQHTWLANELYAEGFTENEKELIIETPNVTTDETIPGVWELKSDDYLYIPAKEELEMYMPDIQLRQAKMTAYVAEKANKEEEDCICWSLRTEGPSQKYTMQITESGEFGSFYTNALNGVRPVMWLNIN